MVLNFSDGTSGNPVNVNFNIGNGVRSGFVNKGLVNLKSKVSSSELFLSEVSEDGDTKIARFIVLDGLEVVSEDADSVRFGGRVSELQAIGGLVSLPLSNNIRGDVRVVSSGEARLGEKESSSAEQESTS